MSESSQEPKKIKAEDAPKPAVNFLLISAGSIFTSMIVAGFLVGYAFDQLFETTPIFLLLCGLLGFVGGMQKVMRLTSRMDPAPKADKNDDQKS